MKTKLFISTALLTMAIATQAQTPIVTDSYISTAGQADLQRNNSIFSYIGAGTPWDGALLTVGGFNTGSYPLQINADYGPNGGNHFSFRTKNDDAGGQWNSWYEIYHSGNLNNSNVDFTAKDCNFNQISLNKEVFWTMSQKDFNASPRIGVKPMSVKLWDNYQGSGSPTSFGTLMEIYGRDSHLVSQLYFDGDWGNSKVRYRSAFYSQNQWSDWKILLDSKSDVESNGNLHITGPGNHYISSGNVLIGKTTQTNSAYKLDVAGKIRADEITVNTTGADFVFEPTYKLRPLAEVETFIKANKHLPEVAPAAEMQTNGVSMGEMQAKLLEKVEELTLYSIVQEKANAELKQKLAEQEKEMKELKELIMKKLK